MCVVYRIYVVLCPPQMYMLLFLCMFCDMFCRAYIPHPLALPHPFTPSCHHILSPHSFTTFLHHSYFGGSRPHRALDPSKKEMDVMSVSDKAKLPMWRDGPERHHKGMPYTCVCACVCVVATNVVVSYCSVCDMWYTVVCVGRTVWCVLSYVVEQRF